MSTEQPAKGDLHPAGETPAAHAGVADAAPEGLSKISTAAPENRPTSLFENVPPSPASSKRLCIYYDPNDLQTEEDFAIKAVLELVQIEEERRSSIAASLHPAEADDPDPNPSRPSFTADAERGDNDATHDFDGDIELQDASDQPSSAAAKSDESRIGPNEEGVYPNGYSFPPKKTTMQSITQGTKGFVKNVLTTFWGVFWTIYGLNVVAWGGMLFLLLCNAGPAMCVLGDGTYDCNNIDSPRRIWIETDSQILTVLFCLPAFGLSPWRFRDAYFLLRWRILGDYLALRRLAGYHKSWFRIRGSGNLHVPITIPEDRVDAAFDANNPAYPLKAKYAPLLPLTGVRASPTVPWKLDFLVWSMIGNTFLQVVLCVFMWHDDRYNRPSWATGLFVALGCIAGGLGGYAQFRESRRIQAVEGVPWKDFDKELATEQARGV